MQTMVEKMNREETGIPREFILKQIENEINAGFVFVAAARKAYKLSRPMEAAGALASAADAHELVSKEVSTSDVSQMRTVIHQLRELREAIDWLRETHLETANPK